MFSAGYLRWGRWGEAPLRWHFSLLFGLAFASGFEARPLSWLLYLGLVLAHEAGHRAAVRRAGLRVIGVDWQALGGETRWNGVASATDQVALAWAGVLAQAGVMLAAKVVLLAAGGATTWWLAEIEHVSIEVNAWIIGLNLLPIPTFDGEVAWKVLTLARGRRIPEQRAIVLRVASSDADDDAGPDPAKVRAAVEAELAELTRRHNEQANGRGIEKSRWG